MVALDHQRVLRGFRDIQAGASAAVDFIVLLHKLPVEFHADEAGVFRLSAGSVKAGGAEDDVKLLPLARRQGGVDLGDAASDGLVLDPAVVDRTAILRFELIGGCSVAVEDLDLVQPLEVDAGIGALGDDELETEIEPDFSYLLGFFLALTIYTI